MNEPTEVLLVEDNPADVRLTLHALEKHHFSNRVQVARDGEEALEYLFPDGRSRLANGLIYPKLVLLDLKLPKISGLEVLQRMKADPIVKTIPVVVLTSSREQRDIIQSYNLGVNSYIAKPVDFEQFVESARILGLYWLLMNEPPILPVK